MEQAISAAAIVNNDKSVRFFRLAVRMDFEIGSQILSEGLVIEAKKSAWLM